MTKSTKTKPSKKSKPLHIEIHGEGIDINATFEGGGDGMSRKEKAGAWAKITQLISNIKVGPSAQPSEDPTRVPSMTIEDVVYVIRVAPPEDLEVIQAAFRARAIYDAKDAAVKDADDADAPNAQPAAS